MKKSFINKQLLQKTATAAGCDPEQIAGAVRLERNTCENFAESFIFIFPRRVMLVRRQSGSPEPLFAGASPEECSLSDIVRRSFRSEAVLQLGENAFNVSWTTGEEPEAELLKRALADARTTTAATVTVPGAPPPGVLFIAGMMFCVGSDAKLSEAENRMMSKYAGAELLQKGVSFYQQTTLEDFTALCRSVLNAEQKTCLLANMLEIAMCDDVFSSEEQEFVAAFAAGIGIGNDACARLEKIILTKNSCHALFAF